jgi:hypothetical protein
MHRDMREVDLGNIRERAAKLAKQADETTDAWFVEQLQRLAAHLIEYADLLEAEERTAQTGMLAN